MLMRQYHVYCTPNRKSAKIMTLRTYFEEIINRKRNGIDAVCLRVIAYPLSLMYILGVRLRVLLYSWGVLKTHSLDVRVISIGNITLGGAGKTPVVAFLAEYLKKNGRRISILSRGYGRVSKGVHIVSTDQKTDWRHSGDEPYLLARRLPQVPVVVGENRVRAGRQAVDSFDSEALLLDDGFQHLRLHRDIDIVVIDASNPFGNGIVFPAGTLREPKGNLNRANLYWLTRVDQADDLPSLRRFLKKIKPENTIVESTYRPVGLRRHQSGSAHDLVALQKTKVILMSGIANPRSFELTASGLGADILQHFTYPDHHAFNPEDIELVQQAASQSRAEFILTTEKDGVRIPQDIEYTVPIHELIIEIHITRGVDDLENLLCN